MKNSTILIVVGIIILISGGIVLMNSFQKESAKSYDYDDDHAYLSYLGTVKDAISSQETSHKNTNTRATSLVMIVAGIIMVGIGVNESRHSLPQKNIKPPEVHN